VPVCPSCGRELVAIALGPDTPPFLCAPCSRAWWQAELDNVTSWRNVERDFGDDTERVARASEAERGQQHANAGGDE